MGPFIIAVDGPVAAGKGTLARKLAAHYGLRCLDTGALYRATAFGVMQARGDRPLEAAAVAAAQTLKASDLENPALRGEAVGAMASQVAVLPAVRSALLEYQRAFAQTPPGAVLDGRDIGTVVCPDADVKLFVTARPEVRARRRFEELRTRGENITENQVLEDLMARDRRDQGRGVAPLRPATDALLLDTSEIGIDAALKAACDLIDPLIKAKLQA